MNKTQEPPLHQALFEGSYGVLQELSHTAALREQVNSLGYTALEIAYYINDAKAIAILAPRQEEPYIPVILRGGTSVASCTPEQFEALFQAKYRPRLSFSSYAIFCRVIDQCPWILAKTHWGDAHRALGEKYRALIQNGCVSKMAIIWVNKKIGYGVIATEELPAGVCIGAYTGHVRALKRLHLDYNGYCLHYPTRFFSWNYFVVDALREGNETRFINHSDNPALAPSWALDRGILHLLLFTRRY